MDVKEFDVLLSKYSTRPDTIIMHPKIWSGYWDIKPYPKVIRKTFRYIGRKLHNKYLYWVGLPLFWVTGIKHYLGEYSAISNY